MTDAEEALMNMGMALRDGLQDMIDQGRLRLDAFPEDDQFLIRMLRDMATMAQRVKLQDDL